MAKKQSLIYLISNTPCSDERIVHLQVCEIKFFEFTNLGEFDSIIITSKNAIKALEFNQIRINLNTQIYAIGEASYEEAKKFGFKNIYLAKNSHGSEFAREILPFLKGKILYLKAKETVSNLDKFLLQNGVNLSVIIAYENVELDLDISQKPPKNSVLIFSSPKNVKSFVRNFGWDESYKAVSIGNTTAQILKPFCEPKICEIQSINSAINLALLIV